MAEHIHNGLFPLLPEAPAPVSVPPAIPEWLTVSEAARLSGASVSTLKIYANTGQVTYRFSDAPGPKKREYLASSLREVSRRFGGHLHRINP